ncbi:hypothetical protein PPTG_21254 [Phytophthora nicotianae INRA-310]|uniref:PiggyBac transposable element-derived protein domain-containing protein n=1 Tax=Phytophthora nicotianae (strain INRA-310) TaxID=761204 RepID=W2R6S0_PHYN3|nr:hypothetical protein PPTG_21254 [Phytophthora nicotianae INRA-310]ETN20215.1 hypothetical protein PPTG_21254 [Phytophthora nicotianae INRA-310]
MARIRRSRREKPAVPAAAAHDIDFGHLWRRLRAAGWKSKRSRGLQTEWSYSSPNNAHVLMGEKSVVEYAFKTGLLEEADTDTQVREEGDGSEQSIQSVSRRSRRWWCARCCCWASLLSEASGLESEGDMVLDEAAVSEPRRRTRTPFPSKDDVNVLLDGEKPSDYENYSSGDSGDDGMSDGAAIPEPSDAVEMDQAFIASLQWTPVSSEYEVGASAYPGLGTEEARPVVDLLNVWRSPILIFFYLMPKSMLVSIAAETNRYGLLQVGKRASKIQERQSDRRRETVIQITRRLKAKSAYATHEILHVVGLLVARMLCPQKRRFGAHWSMVEDGAVTAGLFGRFMRLDRCHDIMRDLHFVDNTIDHGNDKLWKLRPVVDKIQERFLMGWSLPAIFSFDEDVLPATSKRNTTRMFMADKPHRYGPNSLWFEVYVGKRASAGGPDTSVDYKTGAAAVVRNLKVVLAQARHMWHTVAIDRYYSSVPLAIELLSLKVYVIGTIMTNRLGFNKDIRATSNIRPASIPHGTFSFSRSVAIPTMISCVWWDRKPVHYLCTGSVMAASSVDRKIKRIGAVRVQCPSAVNDYQNWMSGVDVHDQLRLQSYSVQMSTRFTKYYKSLFLGLMDMVMVNAYLTHKEGAKIKGAVAMKRSEWFCVLQNQLLQLKAEDFAGVEATPPPANQKCRRTPVRLTHTLQQSEDWVTDTGVQKRRQRSCKVCALLRTEKKKSFATTFFCERCSVDNAKC